MKTNMKLMLIGLVVTLATLVACSHKEEHHEENGEWKELESFHTLMADAYHPLKDSGNVEPAKLLMEKLAAEAEQWAAAPLPAKVDNDDVKAKLQKLKADSRQLASDVKGGAPDDQIGKSLTEIHQQFHGIMEAWEGEKGEKQEHEKH